MPVIPGNPPRPSIWTPRGGSEPSVSAVEEYAKCRERLGDVPLLSAVEEFLRRTNGLTIGVTVPQVVEEVLAAKEQDEVSERYRDQLRSTLGMFAKAFPGPIMHVKSAEIDTWLRKSKVAPITRNNRLTVVRVLFNFAKQRSYLPKAEASEAENVPKVKPGATETEIFQPEEFEKLLLSASRDLIPLIAIGGFAGLRAAELLRLDWSAVNLERRIIELRAGQAKTASRRIVPISDNLAAWLELVDREGMVVPEKRFFTVTTTLARKVGLRWPKNVLRHSYISYRVAEIQDANQVALEAGNSPAIIFKNYRELVTRADAEKWFSIMPPEGWVPPVRKRRRRRKKKDQ